MAPCTPCATAAAQGDHGVFREAYDAIIASLVAAAPADGGGASGLTITSDVVGHSPRSLLPPPLPGEMDEAAASPGGTGGGTVDPKVRWLRIAGLFFSWACHSTLSPPPACVDYHGRLRPPRRHAPFRV